MKLQAMVMSGRCAWAGVARAALLPLVLAACGQRAAAGEPSADDAGAPGADGGVEAGQSATLPPGIDVLDGVDAGMPTDDLAPLVVVVGDAGDVGLGESDHTSGGFEAMKARIVRYLMESDGFRVLAVETPRTRALGVTNQYVQTCDGTPTAALSGMWPQFASDSMRDLLAWMCSYNQQNPGDRVELVGFDMQQPWTDYDALGQFFTQAAPADASKLMSGLTTCDGAQATSAADYWQHHSGDAYAQASFDTCTQGLDAMGAYLSSNQAALTQGSSAQAFALAQLTLVSFTAWQGYRLNASDFDASAPIRDVAMAKIYEGLRSIYFPDEKAILWAHDGHLMRDGAAAGYVRNMGSVLSQDLGSAYAPIGLSGWNVEVDWPGVYANGPTSSPGMSPQVFEWKLEQLGRPWLLVDLDDPGLGSFLTPGAAYQYGNAPSGEFLLVPAAQFRAAIFFQTSPPMTGLDWNTPFYP